MRLTKKVQYALMLALYLSRSGRAKSEAISRDLGLSALFLNKVAGKMRWNGLIRSVRGPSGGYELSGDPTVRDVVHSVCTQELITADEITTFSVGAKEQRSLLYLAINLNSAMGLVMNRKIRNLVNELVMVDRASGRTTVDIMENVSDKVN